MLSLTCLSSHKICSLNDTKVLHSVPDAKYNEYNPFLVAALLSVMSWQETRTKVTRKRTTS